LNLPACDLRACLPWIPCPVIAPKYQHLRQISRRRRTKLGAAGCGAITGPAPHQQHGMQCLHPRAWFLELTVASSVVPFPSPMVMPCTEVVAVAIKMTTIARRASVASARAPVPWRSILGRISAGFAQRQLRSSTATSSDFCMHLSQPKDCTHRLLFPRWHPFLIFGSIPTLLSR
jgi:hypothetical protein